MVLEDYSKGTPSHRRNVSAVKRHLLFAELAKKPVRLLTKGDIETLLQGKKKKELEPQESEQPARPSSRSNSPWSATRWRPQKLKARPRQTMSRKPGLL